MRILITGGAGFLGSNLCETLLNEGHEVTVVDNLITGSQYNVDSFKPNPNYRFFEMGVEDPNFLNEFSNLERYRFDRIYHLACPTGVPNISTLGEEMVETCSTGTKQVLKIALLHGARLLFTSSSEVYGDPLIAPQSEEYTGNVHPQGPRANYEEGKRFSETLISLYVSKYGLQAVTVRLFNVYGPRMSLADTRVIPRFVTQALSGKALTLHGDGRQTRTLCYVDDVVKGLVTVIENGEAGGIYNLGSNKEIPMRELAEIVCNVAQTETQVVTTPRASHDHQYRIPSLERARALGWQQRISLAVGLERTIADFKYRLGLVRAPESVNSFVVRPLS